MALSITLHTHRTAAVDAIRADRASAAVQIAGVVLFALLTALGAQVRIYLWEVPITLQTLFVYGSGLFLGSRNGMLSMLLYLTLGLVFPVYAGEGYGVAYLLAAASTGYLIGMPLAAAVIGTLSKHWNTLSGSVLSLIAGSLTLFTAGVLWLHFAAGHATWAESIEIGWLRFVVFDAAKLIFVGLLYSGVRRLF